MWVTMYVFWFEIFAGHLKPSDCIFIHIIFMKAVIILRVNVKFLFYESIIFMAFVIWNGVCFMDF